MLFKKKENFLGIAVLAGLAQSFYSALIAWLMPVLGNVFGNDQSAFNAMPFLLVVVFSVALSGLFMFGYPVYLMMEHKDWQLAVKSLLISLVTLIVVLVIIASLV